MDLNSTHPLRINQGFTLRIRTTYGCPHNQCAFCSMYKGVPFRSRKLKAIRSELKAAADKHGQTVTALAFPDANFISLKKPFLLSVLKAARKQFPNLQRISCSASPKFLLSKSLRELQQLRAGGLTSIESGIESGDDETLGRMRKGVTSSEILQACRQVQQADIELQLYVMIGLGGQDRSLEHATATAELINLIHPDSVCLVSTVVVPGTPLHDEVRRGEFRELSPYQALQEIRTLIEQVNVSIRVIGERLTGYVQVSGQLPEDRKLLLRGIDYALTYQEQAFERGSLLIR